MMWFLLAAIFASLAIGYLFLSWMLHNIKTAATGQQFTLIALASLHIGAAITGFMRGLIEVGI